MAQSVGASAAAAGAALLRQRSVNVLRGFAVSSAGSREKRASSVQSSLSSKFPCFSRSIPLVFNSGSRAGCNSSSGRCFASSAGVAAPYMLVDKPRPTQYQTEIYNEATDVKAGVEKSSTKGLILLTTLLIVVPIVHTKYELHKYYSEYGHFYKTGWDLYHYDKGKSTYLS